MKISLNFVGYHENYKDAKLACVKKVIELINKENETNTEETGEI